MKKHLDILIVGDLPNDFRIHSGLLRGIPDFNCECTRAEDADHALASLGNRHFDCILLDLSLPDIDGMTLLKRDPRRPPDGACRRSDRAGSG